MEERVRLLREYLNEIREGNKIFLENEINKSINKADADKIGLLMDAIEKLDKIEERIKNEEMTQEKINQIQIEIEANPKYLTGEGGSEKNNYDAFFK